MKPEDMKRIAQEEANKHKHEHVRTTTTSENGKEKTNGEMRQVKTVWVCMPKQQAFLDPTDEQKDTIREHAHSTTQTIFEFEHMHEESKKESKKEKVNL